MILDTKYTVGERVYIIDSDGSKKPGVVKHLKFTEDGLIYVISVRQYHKRSRFVTRPEDKVYLTKD